MWLDLRFARMAITRTIRMHVHLTDFMGRAILWTECLSARGRGITDTHARIMDGLTTDVRMSDAASRIAGLMTAGLMTAVLKGAIATITAASTDVVVTATPMATASTADAGNDAYRCRAVRVGRVKDKDPSPQTQGAAYTAP